MTKIRQDKMTLADRFAGQVGDVLDRGGELGPAEVDKMAIIAATRKAKQDAENFPEAAFFAVELAKLGAEEPSVGQGDD